MTKHRVIFTLVAAIALLVSFWLFTDKPTEYSTAKKASSTNTENPTSASVNTASTLNQPTPSTIEPANDTANASIKKCNSLDMAAMLSQITRDDYQQVVESQQQEFESGIAQQTSYEDQLISLAITPQNKNNDLNQQLLSFAANNPDSKLAFYLAQGACMSGDPTPTCDRLFEQQINVDSDNGLLWVGKAGYYLRNNNTEKAEQALAVAAQANFFSDYHFEFIELFNQAHQQHVQSTTEFNTSINYVSALGYVSALPAYFGSAISYCHQVSNIDVVLNDICFELGNAMATRGKTLFINSMGSSLMETIYQDRQDEEQAKIIAQQREQLLSHQTSSDIEDSLKLLLLDDELQQYWINAGKALGEKDAQLKLVEEIKIKSQNPSYNPCALR